ncbi:hypothetical protein TW95_gp1670 [Pandoravirus inopinatum]|uniref:F-box domain-containing protein n=1 Tax=Pandoravirus inopinatum TaxID=1605721 RepID=A0A0B5J453_9VIRU|nr:hypothetical protein TW95_gp1670 [Pandoravirus inopinatum]AJF98404.1 hypothetical protein [Pandoravirus inopinatum]
MADDPMLCTDTHTQVTTNREASMLIDLPWEIIASVASYLDPNDLCRLGACCRHLSVLRDDARLWRRAVTPLFSQALLDHLANAPREANALIGVVNTLCAEMWHRRRAMPKATESWAKR